ncbi:MAG: CHAT domain-containing tetratricopeptide repeat protein [Pseudomonadota bacterium]
MNRMLSQFIFIILVSIIFPISVVAKTISLNLDAIPDSIPLNNGDEIIVPMAIDSEHFVVVSLTENYLSARLILQTSSGKALQESSFRDLFQRRKLLLDKKNCNQCRIKVIGWSEAKNASVTLKIRQYSYQTDSNRYHAETLSAQAFAKIDSESQNAFQSATSLLKQSLPLWKKMGDVEELANTYFTLGETKDDEVNEDPTLNDYLQLKQLAKEHEDFFIEVRAELALGRLDFIKSNYEDAKTHYQIARQSKLLEANAEVNHKTYFLRGLLDHELAQVAIKLEDWPLAEKTLGSAYKDFSVISDAANMAGVLSSMGYLYRSQNKLDLAAAKHSVAYLIGKHSSDTHGFNMKALYYMGVISGKRGRYFHALELLEKAEVDAFRLQTLHWHAHIKASQGRFNLELDRTSLSKNQLEEAASMYLKLGAEADLRTIYLNLGRLYSQAGDFQTSESFLNKAKSLKPEITGDDHKQNVVSAQIAALVKQKKYTEALIPQQQLLNSSVAGENIYFKGRNYWQLAEILFALGRYSESLDYAKRAAEGQRDNGDDLFFIKSTYLIAKNLKQLKGTSEIINLYLNEGIGKIEEIRASLVDDGLRREYFGLQKALFELQIDINLSARVFSKDEIINALTIAESFKARTLYEALIQKSTNTWENLDQDKASFSGMSTENLLKSATEAFSKKDVNSGSLYEKPLNRLQIEKYLSDMPKNEAALYYFAGSDSTYAWLLSSSEIIFFRLSGDGIISPLINAVFTALSAPPLGRMTTTSSNELYFNLKKLSDLMLGGNAKKLESYSHLTIFPDGPIHRIPFAVLPVVAEKMPLLSSHTISWGLSLTTNQLLSNASPLSHTRESLLLVAPYANKRLAETNAITLRHTKEEADTVSQIWPNKSSINLLIDENATRTKVVEEINKNFSILHFASHTRIDWEFPELTAIGLYPAENTNGSTASLRISDISSWKISPELVVLSACETVSGKNILGEGPMGLARAFIESGALRVVASFWPVGDEATAILMKYFYIALLEKKLSPTSALRYAQLELSKTPKWNHPFYWSGIGIFGNKNTWLEK